MKFQVLFAIDVKDTTVVFYDVANLFRQFLKSRNDNAVEAIVAADLGYFGADGEDWGGHFGRSVSFMFSTKP